MFAYIEVRGVNEHSGQAGVPPLQQANLVNDQLAERLPQGNQRPGFLFVVVMVFCKLTFVAPGLIVMTAELEAAGKSLFVNEVPEMQGS